MKPAGVTIIGALLLALDGVYAAGLTDFVNLFIGTASGANGGSGGNVFPGAAVPHAMVKVQSTSRFPRSSVDGRFHQVGIDVNETPRQAGYIADNSSVTGGPASSCTDLRAKLINVTGISLMHDEGTGGNTAGGYGFFPLFPLTNCTFSSCPATLQARQALRAAGADGNRIYADAANSC